MARPACRSFPARSSAGFTLVEALLALMLLGACLIPASYALRDSLRAPGDNATAAHNLDCVTSMMETVVATPYDVLYSMSNPVDYFKRQNLYDSNCPERQITIMPYGVDSNRTLGPGGNSAFLLYVSVALKDPADGMPFTPFTLTTLVAR